MLRIKKEHLGKRVGKQNRIHVLSENLSQKELQFIKNHVADAFVEEYDDRWEKAMAQVNAYIYAGDTEKSTE